MQRSTMFLTHFIAVVWIASALTMPKKRWRLRARKHHTFICYYYEETNIRSREQLTAICQARCCCSMTSHAAVSPNTSKQFDAGTHRTWSGQSSWVASPWSEAHASSLCRTGRRVGVARRGGAKRWRPHGRSSLLPAPCTQRWGRRLTGYIYMPPSGTPNRANLLIQRLFLFF